MTYSQKLKDPRWQKKRLEILNRDNFKCLMCGDKETELHVHHLVYAKEPWSVDDNELQTLCKHCHEVVEWLKAYPIDMSDLSATTKMHRDHWYQVIMLFPPGIMIVSNDNGYVHMELVSNKNIIYFSNIIKHE